MLAIDQSQAGQTIELPVGQVMELRLQENPTTGFKWSFAADGSPNCALVGNSFAHQAGPPGQGGEHVWRIQGVRVGTCDLSLVYRRSFEANVPPAQSFEIHVKVS